ncbi:unnamed protein product [Symbiodinium necroappetens]|uniref:Uncharacterized protein n=1 Tax=Symbiodinium necroappetens TaxID=1628268 RepID=A0A812MT81_9DINO|nr:unnamed protein product [Symbiodinium necroappetens]
MCGCAEVSGAVCFAEVPQLRPETRRSRTEPSKAVEAVLSDLNEDVGRAPVVSVDTKKSQCSSRASLHRSGSEEMCRVRGRRGKLSLHPSDGLLSVGVQVPEMPVDVYDRV